MTKRKSEQGVPESSQVEALEAPQTARPVESRADKFRRLANRRVPAALKRLKYVANLADRKAYEYTEEQRELVLSALADAMRQLNTAFDGSGQPAEQWSI